MCLGRWQVLIYMFRVLRGEVWITMFICFILQQPRALVVRISLTVSLNSFLKREFGSLDQYLLRGMYPPIR